VIAAATRQGLRVPQDVSVAGFDDSAAARFIWPPLTTVRQPIRDMAYAAIEYLVALAAAQETPPPRTQLPSRLIERDTTGNAPNTAPEGDELRLY